MRISSISIAQPSQYNYKTNVRKTNLQTTKLPEMSQPSFKGWKAGVGGILGAIGGGALAIASGGTLLPVLLASMVGTTGGCIYGSSKEDNSSDYDY